jgi:ribosomal protein L40E
MASAQIDAPQDHQQNLSPVNGQEDQLPFVQDPQTNSKNEDGMVATVTEKVCLHCKRVNPQEARFCNGCGTKLSSNPICKSCGNSNPEGSSFCNKCGFAMA